MDMTKTAPPTAIARPAALVAAVIWTLLVVLSLWTQREQLNRTAESLARIDAITNLKKDMAIRKWAAYVGGVFIKEDRAPNLDSLAEQEHLTAAKGNGDQTQLVALTPIHVLLAIQSVSNQEYGIRERLTSLQLRNLDNAPDEWETNALEALKGGSDMVSEAVPKKGSHGLMRLMLPMRMEEECIECHRDTLVPVGGLRGAAAISVDLNAYRTAQEPTWRSIQYWHFAIWLLGLTTIYTFSFFLRRRALEQAGQEEERRENETAFAAMAEGAIITDARGTILWVNDAFCRIYGYERDEVIGKNPRLLKSGYHDEAFYRDFWSQLTRDGHWRGELWNRRRNGEVFPEESSIQALRGPDGAIRRYIAIFSDITERKQNEAELARYREHLEELVRSRTEELTVARDQAEAANRSKSAFLANMSHELRTPLNAVIGFSQLMDRDPDLSPAQRRNLEIINGSGHHLLTLINDVLELSKIESGKMHLVIEEIAPGELLRQVIDMVRVRAEQAGLALSLAAPGLPRLVMLDPVKLRQVLLNLLSNAVKFTPAGGVTLRVDSQASGEGRVRLDFEVADTGVGIAAEDQERIFSPFEQAGARSHQAGTGLGLTISRQYVRMMGGELTVQSAPGQGARFRFSITVSAGHGEAAGPRDRIVGLAPADRGRRILVVDDMAEARLLVRSLLAPLGFAVAEAEDGAGALRALAGPPPDLIFIDWRLPDIDGLEAIHRIRTSAEIAQPKIVMLTANALADSRARALAAGADDFMSKPFEEADLYAMLEKHLGLRFERAANGAPLIEPPPPAPVAMPDLGRLTPATHEQLRRAALSLSPEAIAAALAKVDREDPALAAALRPLSEAMHYRRLWQALGIADTE